MPNEFGKNGVPPDEFEAFAGEVIELNIGDKIEFQDEDGVKRTGVIEQKIPTRKDPNIFGFMVLLDEIINKPNGGFTLRKIILSDAVLKRI